MIDGAALRILVRHGLRGGTLPRGEPDHRWDGPGLGAPCAVCTQPLRGDEVGYEIQFAHHRHGSIPGRDRYPLHVECFAAWEQEHTMRHDA
jgi:hypothetical protein